MTRLAVLVSAVAVLLLAGCAGPETPVADPTSPGMARGLDLPTDARDVSQELASGHFNFVARYYRPLTSHWPSLSAAEARQLSAAGLKLVAVWESTSHRPGYFSYATGYADALAAYRQAWTIGQPPGSAIYFAVDFNAQPVDIWGGIDRYFRGIRAGLAAQERGGPGYEVGVYGSGAVCDYLKRARLVRYTWLSNSRAWAGYRDFADWNIRQAGRWPFLSFDQDANEARGDYGAFRVGMMSARAAAAATGAAHGL